MLQRMNIGLFIEREPSIRQQLALIDLCLTVLQNSTQGLEFQDFTDNELLVWRMRRREFETVHGETRSLDNRFQSLASNFESHRTTSTNAISEFVTLIGEVQEEFRGELTALKTRNQDIL